MQIEGSKNYLHRLNDKVASCKALLNSYHILCERKRQETENLNNEITRLEAVVSQFKHIWSGKKLVSSSLIRIGIFPCGPMRGLIFIRFDFYKLTFIIIIIL